MVSAIELFIIGLQNRRRHRMAHKLKSPSPVEFDLRQRFACDNIRVLDSHERGAKPMLHTAVLAPDRADATS